MYRRYALTLAARSRWRSCMRTLNSCDPPHILPSSSSSPSFLPIFASSRMQYASRGRGRRGPPSRTDDKDDDYDDDAEDDGEEDDEFEEEVDTPGYEWDYETWNLLHQGRKEGQSDRKWPLPMYKAREMVDFHMIKNRLDGLKIITDPKMEYELRKKLHEGLVDLYKKTQAANEEIEALQEKMKLEESGDKKEVLQVTEGETKGEDSENQSSGKVASDVKDAEGASSLQVAEGEIKKTEATDVGEELKDVAASTLDAGGEATDVGEELMAVSVSTSDAGGAEASQEEGSAEGRDLSTITTAVDDIIKDVLSVPEITTLELAKDMAVSEETAEDDGVNVFDYDKWVAYRERQVAKRYAEEEERKHATLRWKIQLVLGPGDVVHPANRKASVSVYVRELCLSKYAKQRLLALVGKRYNSPKDELTIVSERYPHRYENQKDVLRTLLALIEEAKKADQLVYDARIGYLKAKNAELKKAATSIAAI